VTISVTYRFDDAVILITGAGSGIGLVIVNVLKPGVGFNADPATLDTLAKDIADGWPDGAASGGVRGRRVG
jgi:NAD(P)-dependent dehydrogenase (short-subunit alcohol dehydrogenase family)